MSQVPKCLPCWRAQHATPPSPVCTNSTPASFMSVCNPCSHVMLTLQLAALPDSAARRLQSDPARSCIHERPIPAPLQRCRQHLRLAAVRPPSQVAWPQHHHFSASSVLPAQSKFLCRASQDAQGGAPDPQQQQQQQQSGGNGAQAGSWQGSLQRSDSWVYRACRWATVPS